MHLTYQERDGSDSARQAGTEIEVTPAMVEAAQTFWQKEGLSDYLNYDPPPKVLSGIFEAMRANLPKPSRFSD